MCISVVWDGDTGSISERSCRVILLCRDGCEGMRWGKEVNGVRVQYSISVALFLDGSVAVNG